MPPTLFAGGIATETNTFSPIPTSLQDFECYGPNDAGGIFSFPPAAAARVAERNWELIKGSSAMAQPAGTTVLAAYETLCEQLLSELRAALPVSAVHLILHGAMVVEGIDDAELDLVTRIRKVVGADTKIGVELDLHCHVDQRLLEVCDIVITCKEYPHVDIADCALQLVDFLIDAAEDRSDPKLAMFDCKVVGLCSTFQDQMREFVEAMNAVQARDDVIALSLAHGFPYGDVPHAGAKMIVISDGDQALAESLAAEFGQRYYAMRQDVLLQPLSLDDALNLAVKSSSKPVVVADQADNPGGGAPGDSTFALAWLLRNKVDNAGIAMIYDPEVVKLATAAGTGAELPLRLGGKTGVTSGDPLDVQARILTIIKDYEHEFPQGEAAPLPVELGDTTCIQIGGIYVLVTSRRSQCFSPKIWRDFGIDPVSLDIIVVKSTNHFFAAHKPLSNEIIYMSSQGALAGDPRLLNYQHMSTADKYPWHPAPHG